MMYEPPLSIFMCTALRCTHVRICSSRAAAVAAVMADAKIERRRKIEAGRKGSQEAALANLQAVGVRQSFQNARSELTNN